MLIDRVESHEVTVTLKYALKVKLHGSDLVAYAATHPCKAVACEVRNLVYLGADYLPDGVTWEQLDRIGIYPRDEVESAVAAASAQFGNLN